MKIISYNVNGIRAATKKGLVDWLQKEDPDVFCVQETKAQIDQIDSNLFSEIGYKYQYWHSAQKKGYSGVASYCKQEAQSIQVGINDNKYDNEGRILTTVVNNCAIINCYFPSGSSGEIRHNFKLEFLFDFYNWIKKQQKKYDQIVVLGDYNVVHNEIDIHNPKRKDRPSGYTNEERAWMDKWFLNGFTDAYRFLHPKKQDFSWWSYRAGARKNNKGWRIDYISVTDNLQDKIRDARQLTDVIHSDHCPILINLNL